MKRKIMALLLMVMMVAFTGCNSVQAGYWNKMKEVSKWEGTDTNQIGQVVVNMGQDQLKIDFKNTGHFNQKQMAGYIQMEMKVTMPENMMPTTVEGMKNQPITVNMEMYLDQGKVYINKADLQQIFAITGEPMPELLKNLDVEYIGFKGSDDLMAVVVESMGDKAKIEETLKIYEKVGKLLGIDIPVVQEGDTYKVSLGKQEIIALIKKKMNNGVTNVEKLNDQLKLGLTKEDIESLKADYATEKEQIESEIDQLASFVDGNIVFKTTFEKNKQVDTFELKIGPSPEITPFLVSIPGSNIQLKVELNQTSTKVVPKTIKIPGKTVELSEQVVSGMMGM